jgi:TetR/AcrR family transcriptional repressor of nem operon
MGRTSDARDRLLEGAIRLFQACSYHHVAVSDLCDYAGVKKGSFYHFFESKQDLTLQALDLKWEQTRRYLLSHAFSPHRSPAERIRRQFEIAFGYARSCHASEGHVSGCGFGNLALELGAQDEIIRQKLDEIFKDWTDLIRQVLEYAVRGGQILTSDPQTVARGILAFLEGSIMLAKVSNHPESIRELTDQALLLAGLESPAHV